VRRRTRLAVLVALGLVAAALAGTLALRQSRFGDRLRHGTLGETGPGGVRVDRPLADRAIAIPGDGPDLAADVWLPGGAAGQARAAILLVHGNRGEGSASPFYRLLARRLADRGALVLSMNLRGYGASAPAPAGRAVRASDLLEDVERGRAALDELAPAGVPRGTVGHSLGANLVLRLPPRAGWRAVAIEPGARLRERVVVPPAPELETFAEKLRGNLRGPAHDLEAVRALYRDLDPEIAADPVAASTVLLIQGRRIDPAALASIQAAAAARPGCLLMLVDSADHEFGAAGLGSWVVFPGRLVDRLAEAVGAFVATGTTAIAT